MLKIILPLFLCLVSSICYAQKINFDSCMPLPKNIKAYISGTDSTSIKLSEIKKGFTLVCSNPNFKIVAFTTAFIDESTDWSYYTVGYTGPKFYVDKYEPFKLHIDGAKLLFIDQIFVIINNKCYSITPIVYEVKH